MKKARAALISLIIAMPVISCYEAPKSSTEQEIGVYLLFEYGAPNFCLNAETYITTTEGSSVGPLTGDHCFRMSTTNARTFTASLTPSDRTFLMQAWTPLRLNRNPETDELYVPYAVDDLWVWAGCPDCTSYSVNL